jgi:oligosaccharide reducing-end xylanase
MQRNYNLKGCKVNGEKTARGAYYGRIVPVK